MGEIETYKNEGDQGVFCGIKLESKERILIGIAQTGIKVSKLGLGGLIPIKTIWESSDLERNVTLTTDLTQPVKAPLDVLVDKLILCKSIDEVKKRLL